MSTTNHRTLRAAAFFALSAILVISGCQADRIEAERSFRSHNEVLTIRASYEQPEVDTKTVRDDKANIYWTPGDAISLFYGSGADGGSKFVALTQDVSKTTNFSGTITAVTGGADIEEGDTYFWGLYPYDETASCDGQTVTMTIPAVQPGMDDTFAPGYAPSLGHSQGLMLSFRNIWSGFGFTVSEAGYQTVTFKGNNNEDLAGRAKIGIDENGLPYVVEILEGIKEVTITAPTNAGFVPGQYYYMQFFPGILSSGFTVKISNATKTGTWVYDKSMTYPRSTWKRAANIDTREGVVWEDNNNPTYVPFEDANFKAYCVENFDKDNDGDISYSEATKVYAIDIYTDDVFSLKGIEYFPNLKTLKCRPYGNGNSISSTGHGYVMNNGQEVWGLLTSLDVSNNLELQCLQCQGNHISELLLDKNTKLRELDCSYNPLRTIEIEKCKQLRTLIARAASLSIKDYSCFEYLSTLDISANLLERIVVCENTYLTQLLCSYNHLTSLDVSNNLDLIKLECDANYLSTIDVTKNDKLSSLGCRYNRISSIDLSKNAELTWLNCGETLIRELDISNNEKLGYLYCYDCKLTSIDVSKNPYIQYLYVNKNYLTSLDVSNNTQLVYLLCQDNLISHIDLSKNKILGTLLCNNNSLESLDVSNNLNLSKLSCINNPDLKEIWLRQGQVIDSFEYDSTAEIKYKP